MAEKLSFIKPDRFGWQDEYPVVIPKRGAFDIENVVVTLETGPAGSVSAQAFLKIKIGSLTGGGLLPRL